MNEQLVTVYQALSILRRNAIYIFVSFAVCIGITAFILSILQPKFKSKAVLNIESSYFQSVMVSDLMSQVYDTQEQNAQRQSLLRLAINVAFIESIGNEFKLFKLPSNDPMHAYEVESLLKSIEYFPQSSTAYEVSILANSPRLAYDLNRRIIDQMIDTLVSVRHRKLVQLRDSITSRVKSLSGELKGSGSHAATMRLGSVRTELDQVTTDIAAMSAQYSPLHPDVVKLKQKRQALQNILKNLQGDGAGDSAQANQEMPISAAEVPTQEVYNELIKKLNYLNIVVDMEDSKHDLSSISVIEPPSMPISSVFPPRMKLLLAGFAAGVLLSIIMVAFLELRRGTFLAPAGAATALGIPLLGQLPRFESREEIPLLPDPGESATCQLLPAPMTEA